MKLANAIEDGIAGVSTLTLIKEALAKIDCSKPPIGLLKHPGILAKIKKKSKKGKIPVELYLQLASELLSGAAYFGLRAVGKKKNFLLSGALLGAAAGVAIVFFNYDKERPELNREQILKSLLTVGLYTSGGLLAGAAVRKLKKRRKKKK